jgi:membrane-associated protease RseP (regulator of RpoE activity)
MTRSSAFRSLTFVLAVFLALPVFGQVRPKNRDAKNTPGPTPAQPAVPAQPAAPAPGEAPGQVRREGREEARESRTEARQAGETGPQARQTARETRQETRQNVQATRGADLGVWFNSRAADGLIVADIATSGVFANVGLREGDRIVSINGQPVTTEAQFVQILTGNLGTQPVQIIVIRNGQQQTLTLQPTALTQGVVNSDPLYQYGIVIDDQNPNQIVVQRVYPRTPAYYAGLRQGDVITTLGGQRIANINAFTQGLLQTNGNIPLQITRAGQTREIELEAATSGDTSVRTALRPNIDAAASGAVGAQTGAQVAAPGANVNAPGASVDAGTQAQGQLRTGQGATPATPAAPATPATPGTRATPAAPATPATPSTPPASPRAGTGAGANVGAGANAGAGATAGAGANTGAPRTGAGVNAGAGSGNQPGAGAGANVGAGAGGTGAGAGAKVGAGAGGTGAGAGAGVKTGSPK